MPVEANDPIYARYLVWLTRPFPDFDFSFIKPVRQKAVGFLNLKRGDRVLDAGCGSGGSFAYLQQCVGPSGQIVGIEISPGTIINTKRRIAKNKWENIQIIEGDAKKVQLPGDFDGLLMFAAPDVFASADALSNILPHLKEGARIAIFGAKISKRRFGWLLNGLLRLAFNWLSFSSGPKMETEPWTRLEHRVGTMHIGEYFFGWMFLAWGQVEASRKV
ncbi:MAG TPA: methyltransferase domain-containing protein [Cyclobacteriaceae bacterium]|nr:methyltransferase domain-containing protein [Cyclobacteriaceae bacterium]